MQLLRFTNYNFINLVLCNEFTDSRQIIQPIDIFARRALECRNSFLLFESRFIDRPGFPTALGGSIN
jgi:hypothetical protein